MSEYIDHLSVDPSIPTQQFACISFISPEEIIKSKNIFMFENFLNNYDLNKSLSVFGAFLDFISYKYKIDKVSLDTDFNSFVESEKEKITTLNCSDDFKSYLDKHESKLEAEFNKLHNFQTNIRGIKIRGCYEFQHEAEMRCKLLREIDPSHDIYVGPVGNWVPWHPEAYKTKKVEYLEEELNNLMNEKNVNEETARNEFEQRIKLTKEQAIAENIQKAQEHGNKLSQTINDTGDLVNVNATDNNLVSIDDIEKELFNSNDVRLKDDKEVRLKT
jgi:hypothetical protein